MSNIKKILVPALGVLLLSSSLLAKPHNQIKEDIGTDNAIYTREDGVYDMTNKDLTPNKKVKAAVTYPDRVVINYHNDDAECASRTFWIWASGVNGAAYEPASVSSDGKDMSLTMDFNVLTEFKKKKSISFIVKYKDSWTGQSVDVLFSFEEYPPVDGTSEIWCIPGEGNDIEVYATQEETQMDKAVYSTFTDWKNIEVISTIVPDSYRVYAFTSNYYAISSALRENYKNNYLIKEGTVTSSTPTTFNHVSCVKFNIALNHFAHINAQYVVETIYSTNPNKWQSKRVTFDSLYETTRFETYYTYDGDDLGVTYSSNETTFKVWAPSAVRVRLYLYQSGTSADIAEEMGVDGSDTFGGYNMVFKQGGVWTCTIKNRDLDGYYYKYYVINSLGANETVDPYAKATGVSGDRSMICDFSKTDPENWDSVPEVWDNNGAYDIANPNSLTIYETHIRDLTMDETWTGTEEYRGTYKGFVESGTTYTKNSTTVTTGFDHLTEMGVTAVQLEPVFDGDNDETKPTYNWGYNPVNYNCVEGSYSTNPYDGAVRVKEFKELVKAFANNGNHTRVIMDVVYNHVASAPASCFNKLMPRYYYRYASDGTYYNGSGCGNEVKSEAPMMRKYIVDSLCWWASEYKIKGFRFDLMGLIDYKTLDKAREELYKIDPDIYLYGEGWTGDGQDAHIDQDYYGTWGANSWTVYNKMYDHTNKCWMGCFNDAGRNALKGENDLDPNKAYGFICQGSDYVGNKSSTVADMIVGYHTGTGGNPNQCINYASCHDNYTLYDQMTFTAGDNGTRDCPGVPCAAVAATECTILFSNGVAFLHGGEELFRTKEVTSAEDLELISDGKGGYSDTSTIAGHLISHNSYNLSDAVNSYKWDRKIAIGSTNTTGYVEAIRKAIEVRKLLPKYDYDQLQSNNPYSSSSPFNVWNQGDGSTCLGVKNNEYFFFVAGCNSDDIPFSAISSMNYSNPSFCSNIYYEGGVKKYGFTYDLSGGTIKLGWFTCVCFKEN